MASSACVCSTVPFERFADDVELRSLIVAHHAIAFEQPIHQSGDHVGVLLREPFVHDQNVGDDQQVLARREDVGLAAAFIRDFGRFRRPRDATRERVAARLQFAQEEIARGERVGAKDEIQLVRLGPGLQVGQAC